MESSLLSLCTIVWMDGRLVVILQQQQQQQQQQQH